MKTILILIIGIILNAGDIYSHEEAYIIDDITKQPNCPKTKKRNTKTELSCLYGKCTHKKTYLLTCRTKKDKIKITIRKEIQEEIR